MKSEVDQLLEDLDDIRSNAGTAGSDHPKVKKWVAAVRSHLAREGNKTDLKKFDQLKVVKGGSEMWSRDTMDPSSIKTLKAELGIIEAILEKMTGTPDEPGHSSADQKMRELFLTPDEESHEEAVPEETPDTRDVDHQVNNRVEKRLGEDKDERQQAGQMEIGNEKNIIDLEKTMDQKIEANFEAVSKQHLSSSAREKAVDQLMEDLKTQMKSSEPDWEKIQAVMSDMMGLKKTGELLERLNTTANTPGVPWEIVRDSMAKLWSIKKEIVIDFLPTLLKPDL